MAKYKFWLGMMIMAAVSAIAAIGCTKEPSLVGAWVNSQGMEKRFSDNGRWEISVDGTPNVRGTYTVDGDTITRKMTHLHGGIFEELESKWYSEGELRTAVSEKSSELFHFMALFPFERQTEIYTYSITGKTVTFTYTGTDEDDYETLEQTFTRK